jgi:hypothetical protein
MVRRAKRNEQRDSGTRSSAACVACLISDICPGETSPMTATEIVIPHVKIKNATFRDALSSVKVYLENAHLRMVDDKVNDVPADYDSPEFSTLKRRTSLSVTYLRHFAVIMAFSGPPPEIQLLSLSRDPNNSRRNIYTSTQRLISPYHN